MSLSGPAAIADFDSASAMLRALGAFLHGEDFPALGLARAYAPPVRATALLPLSMRRQLYALGGWLEAQPARRVAALDEASVARWMTAVYPARQYPAIAIGSSNGALVHLFAALGIPWLPQTWLLPLRQPAPSVDDGVTAMQAATPVIETLLARCPDLAVHHMHDPVQDRLMLRHMSYLRLKRLRLGRVYETFIRRHLAPGGTLLLVDGRQQWPVTRLSARHVFQYGAVGGLGAEAFHGGGRTAFEAFVAGQGDDPHAIAIPPANDQAPEAEWGFDHALAEDVERVAGAVSCHVRDLVLDTPDAASGPVADLHRAWYRALGQPDDRLLGESFILLDPMQALRQALVPFWMVFNKEASADDLSAYVDSRGPFAAIHSMLFAHGIEGAGLPSLDTWRSIVGRATDTCGLLGIDPQAWPIDLGVFARYHDDLAALPGDRFPPPPPLPLETAEAWLAARPGAGFRLL